MKTSGIALALYLTYVTIGFALVLSDINWLCLFGCAIILATLLFSGRLADSHPLRKSTSYIGLCLSFLGGFWQFIQAARDGFPPSHGPPHRPFVILLILLWLLFVLGEIRRARRGPSSRQGTLPAWIIRRLNAMPPEKREKFLARFDQKTQELYRKKIESQVI